MHCALCTVEHCSTRPTWPPHRRSSRLHCRRLHGTRAEATAGQAAHLARCQRAAASGTWSGTLSLLLRIARREGRGRGCYCR